QGVSARAGLSQKRQASQKRKFSVGMRNEFEWRRKGASTKELTRSTFSLATGVRRVNRKLARLASRYLCVYRSTLYNAGRLLSSRKLERPMAAQPNFSNRFVRKTQLSANEYHKNFSKLDVEIITAITSAEEDK